MLLCVKSPSKIDRMPLSSQQRQVTTALLHKQLQQRILLLDGAMGTMIQKHELSEADFRGERFKDWPSDMPGNNALLTLTQPE